MAIFLTIATVIIILILYLYKEHAKFQKNLKKPNAPRRFVHTEGAVTEQATEPRNENPFAVNRNAAATAVSRNVSGSF